MCDEYYHRDEIIWAFSTLAWTRIFESGGLKGTELLRWGTFVKAIDRLVSGQGHGRDFGPSMLPKVLSLWQISSTNANQFDDLSYLSRWFQVFKVCFELTSLFGFS